MAKQVVRFSDRPPSMYEPPREPSEEEVFDFYERFLKDFEYPPSKVEPSDLEELPRLPSFSTRDSEDTVYPLAAEIHGEAAGADRQQDTIFPFADLDLPSPSMLQIPDGPLPFEECPSMEMEDMVPHERQSMMPDSEYGPAPPLELLERMKHRDFQVKLPLPPPPAPPVFSETDVCPETPDLPLGISALPVQAPQETMFPQTELTEHSMVLEDENIPPPSWCGMWNMNCREGKCGTKKKVDDQNCVRCRKPLESFLDHQCPKCKVWFCVKCAARYPLNWFRCKCGDMEANQEVLRKNTWKIKAYHSTYQAVKSLNRGLSSLSSWMPSFCRNQETAQSLKDPTVTQLPGGEVPAVEGEVPARTLLPTSFQRQQVPLPRRKKPYRPGRMPLPPPPRPVVHEPSELPHLLGRHSLAIPMNYYETDPFRTRLPGEMED